MPQRWGRTTGTVLRVKCSSFLQAWPCNKLLSAFLLIILSPTTSCKIGLQSCKHKNKTLYDKKKLEFFKLHSLWDQFRIFNFKNRIWSHNKFSIKYSNFLYFYRIMFFLVSKIIFESNDPKHIWIGWVTSKKVEKCQKCGFFCPFCLFFTKLAAILNDLDAVELV